MSGPTRIAIVVGEVSGDILGAGLIQALQVRYPECVFEGIGGPLMIASGFQSHFPMERLAVMGLVEPLKRLPELLSIRKQLKQRYRDLPPDCFIGIDAPDFNLSLEAYLKSQGVKTAHYVSPSVWAWRQGRVKKISKAVDLMLTLFPFEAQFYQDHNVNVKFVGHPLADKIPVDDQTQIARERLGLDPQGKYLAILPGSRRSEVEKLCPLFLQAAEKCCADIEGLVCLIPAANASRRDEIEAFSHSIPELPLLISEGNSHDVMAAANVVLMASGTTTLEALLLKKPMVIAYRMAALSFWILKRLVKSPFVGLPNILANTSLVPELLQEQASVENLSKSLLECFKEGGGNRDLIEKFTKIHLGLKNNASKSAAGAIEALCQK